MTTWADGDSDAICILGHVLHIWRCFVLGLVQLKTDVRKIVQFWNGTTLDLGWYPTFEDTVEQGVDMRFFCEIHEGLGVIRSLHLFKIFDNFLIYISNAARLPNK